MAQKQELVRALITKICEEKRIPDVKFERWFLQETDWSMLEYLKGRKGDLPSKEFLSEQFKFKPFDSKYTLTDTIELLNKEFVKEAYDKMFNQVIETIGEDTFSITELLDATRRIITNTNNVVTATNNTSGKDVDKFIEDYDNWNELKEPILTGFERIDEEAPLRRGEVACLIGGTGGGKSATAIKMFAENIKNRVTASLFSLEMNRLQVLMRILPIMTGGKIKNSELRYGLISKERFKEEVEKLSKNYNIITRLSSAPIKISTIEAHLEEQKAAGKPVEVIYIDYLGLLDQDIGWNAEEKVSAQLKRLAIQYNCLVVILVQADTETIKSGNMPTITSIADNKGIARDCDCVFALKSVRKNDKDNKLLVEYQMLKRREDGGFINFQLEVDLNRGIWEETFFGAA